MLAIYPIRKRRTGLPVSKENINWHTEMSLVLMYYFYKATEITISEISVNGSKGFAL